MRTKKDLTDNNRTAILQQLLARMVDHKTLPRRALAASPSPLVLTEAREERSFRQEPQARLCCLTLVPKARRTTFRSIAAAMTMPKSTLHDYHRRGIFVKYSSTVKPALTDVNKAHNGLCRCGRKVVLRHASSQSNYLAPDEDPPHLTVKSKTFIMKVMFLSTVARSRWDHDKCEWFDGKIGTWHFTDRVPALRGSRNTPAGTMVMKPVSVTRDVYTPKLLDKVIPAIKANWPQDETKGVIIQQDNSRPHVPPSDPRIVAACTSGGWAMQERFQPPQMPDLNVLDLGFFRAL
ncbi:hypothetical protein H257_05481 [Aphanomyces astaci]|uniref:Uncharacterized protein n=1 Tax=Aphanomyces astaci TaxID=112090 RepID=W4GSS2_APHAT|nr:hypothetical protein H257_05481 [Aphanomyces astaci]ETV81943.1 hypothetical protein H257_05481 [Aphanomyces astaci]|eukprot:XP_009828680.1 hypothetical protein H257_05481 [Aphanomyces astaci]